jgi:DNA-directed RNA polymerase subunit RPC12/RpoP
MLTVKKAPFVVTLVADLRPLVVGLNRELVVRGADPVRREELTELDEMLHEGLPDRDSPVARCRHCGGYVCGDTVGEYTCLNCGRPINDRGPLEDVIDRIVEELLGRRERSSTPGNAL